MGHTHQALLERHRAVMPSWLALYYEQPIEIASGSGRRVRDGEGREYLDFFAGILTTMLGYDDPAVRAALEKQLGTGVLHTSTLYLIRQQVELAERIAERSGIPDARVFFTSSGTEANEAALLLASQYRRSNQVLAMRNSYHGRAFATVGITGNRGWSASSLSPVQTSYLGGAYRYRSPLRHLPDEEYNAAYAQDLREVLATTTSGDVACLVAEPIQGVGGFATPPDGFYGALKSVLDEHGILFVSDEVQTGWGRTGEHFWGYQAHGVVPDALTFAKGLGNGLAIGGVVARAEVMDSLQASSISTFGGNPLATAGAAAVLDQVETLGLQGNAARVGRRLREGLTELAHRHPVVGDVRGKGLMLGVELVEPAEDGAPAPAAATRVLEAARERGLLVGKGGLYGNVLRIAPPLTVTEAEADEALAALADAVETAS
ncbi:aspartate aminotransferase family protein [Ornithinicoccus halotolerans]|uniref:aspartate aminotransferase family protein n=1 Tax=Ornithinicoccus halotolerans TaxID=1748220 RepID=UPI001298111B|nr:aspartate aminotransferase family protein [Ornithinicoccus halotolerans]